MMEFFIYFFLIQLAYYLWAGFLNAISSRLYNLKRFATSITKFSVYFHELMHFLIAKMLFLPVKLSDIVIFRGNGTLKITPRSVEGLTFIQATAISLSPPFFSTIVIILLSRMVFALWSINWMVAFLLIVIGLSILQVAIPSFTDLKNIFSSIYHRPLTTARQVAIIFGGYSFYTNFQTRLLDFFAWIPERLFAEPICLISVIFGMEMLISLIFVIGRFFLGKIIKTGDFHGIAVRPTIHADTRHLNAILPLKKENKSLDDAEQELCEKIQ